MGADRQIAGLLRQVASKDVVVLTHPFSVASRLAALAYVAEQYGFAYVEARRDEANKQAMNVYLYRDPSPEARQREVATISRYPQAGNGGPVPGMRPGTLKPDAGAREAVARLKDRIGFDVLGDGLEKGPKRFVGGMFALVVLMTLLDGKYILAKLVGGVALGAALAGLFRLSALRRGRMEQRLLDAGFVPVSDQYGRRRFLAAGEQLPGHANPFAG
ncbi:hypothetical protein [Streptomyces sp. NPDC051219]|uniref:hypothetical protein n=1 Tax=Streptomyces sp. NPDC051219 TaxID=3155283 RepID=UPI003433D917